MNKKVLVKCFWCEKEFEKYEFRVNESIKLGTKTYCSKSCFSAGRKAYNIFKRLNPDFLFEPTGDMLRNQEYECELCGAKHKGTQASGRFCSRLCSRSASTAKNRKETSEKVSKTMKAKNAFKWEKRTCLFCDTKFKTTQRKNKKLCSKKCSNKWVAQQDEYREKMRQIQLNLIKQGKHKGWKSRLGLKPSYPELFFMKVLNNNKIYFKREYKVGSYHLDFYIETDGRKIDLEIDGKQHDLPNRKKNDQIRTNFLEAKGYEVYRIRWKSPKTYSQYLKDEIDKMIDFVDYHKCMTPDV